ncbi:hypothetical protein HK097_010979 [Rhizophlyctis rosea]|uniref:Homeobox domain-containing protein n=1 Tax=Rhizophlyctis rosea TaxID=64517 RepID=A0AAD5S8K7_9FUNG|nr:hypothetical protein HK097_010979 [Rhizophlyctis rosea]
MNPTAQFYNPFEIKHRRRTSQAQLKVLEKAFADNPKPNGTLRRQLAQTLEMTPRGVQVWFQNRRAKAKHQRILAELEQAQRANAANNAGGLRRSAESASVEDEEDRGSVSQESVEVESVGETERSDESCVSGPAYNNTSSPQTLGLQPDPTTSHGWPSPMTMQRSYAEGGGPSRNRAHSVPDIQHPYTYSPYPSPHRYPVPAGLEHAPYRPVPPYAPGLLRPRSPHFHPATHNHHYHHQPPPHYYHAGPTGTHHPPGSSMQPCACCDHPEAMFNPAMYAPHQHTHRAAARPPNISTQFSRDPQQHPAPPSVTPLASPLHTKPSQPPARPRSQPAIQHSAEQQPSQTNITTAAPPAIPNRPRHRRQRSRSESELTLAMAAARAVQAHELALASQQMAEEMYMPYPESTDIQPIPESYDILDDSMFSFDQAGEDWQFPMRTETNPPYSPMYAGNLSEPVTPIYPTPHTSPLPPPQQPQPTPQYPQSPQSQQLPQQSARRPPAPVPVPLTRRNSCPADFIASFDSLTLPSAVENRSEGGDQMQDHEPRTPTPATPKSSTGLETIMEDVNDGGGQSDATIYSKRPYHIHVQQHPQQSYTPHRPMIQSPLSEVSPTMAWDPSRRGDGSGSGSGSGSGGSGVDVNAFLLQGTTFTESAPKLEELQQPSIPQRPTVHRRFSLPANNAGAVVGQERQGFGNGGWREVAGGGMGTEWKGEEYTMVNTEGLGRLTEEQTKRMLGYMEE